MTKNDVISFVFKSKMLSQICSQIADPLFRDDLEQEIYIVILKKDEQTLVQLWESKQMRFYLTRIAINMYRSSSSKFTKVYKQYEHFEQVDEIPETEVALNFDHARTPDLLFEIVQSEMSKWDKPTDFPYFKQLFWLYLRSPSMAEMSRLTGIPYRTIKHTIFELKQKLKKAIYDTGYFDK